jgi:hypothetical protein
LCAGWFYLLLFRRRSLKTLLVWAGIYLPFIRRVQWWGLIIGGAGNAAFAVGGSFDPSPTSVIQNVGRMVLALCRSSNGFLLCFNHHSPDAR